MADGEAESSEPKKAPDDGRIRAKVGAKRLKLSVGHISGEIEGLNLGLDFKLPESPEKAVKTRLRQLDGAFGLRSRAWYHGKRQMPETDSPPNEAQRDVISEKARYDNQLNETVRYWAKWLVAEILCRRPPHYTREQINEFVRANWRARQDMIWPGAIARARGVVETEEEISAFRRKHDLVDQTPEDVPYDNVGLTFWVAFAVEMTLNGIFYRDAFAENLMVAIGLASIFSFWIMFLAASLGRLGVSPLLNSREARTRTWGWFFVALLVPAGAASAVGLGLLRYGLAADSGKNLGVVRIESLALASLNIMVLGWVAYKFRNGENSQNSRFRRLWENHQTANNALNIYLTRGCRAYMDAVLDYYRRSMIGLKQEIMQAKAPVLRAAARFDAIQCSAETLQRVAGRDTVELILTYRERNRTARRVFSFIGWITGLKKTPAPNYFAEDVPDPGSGMDPLLDYRPEVNAAVADHETKLAEIEASADTILIDLGGMAKDVGEHFRRYRDEIVADARLSIGAAKSARGHANGA